MKKFVIYSTLILLSVSCRKQWDEERLEQAVFPTTEKEKQYVALIKELGDILKKVYINQDALDEVNAAIYSEYDRDESISIVSLLSRNSVGLYQHPAFKKMRVKEGTFQNEFLKHVSPRSHPLVSKYFRQYLDGPGSASNNMRGTSVMVGLDSLPLEVFQVEGIKIYFPYSESWGALYNPGAMGVNDPDANLPRLVTIVMADREADSGPGSEPYIYQAGRDAPKEIRWKNVTVNDQYADGARPTHIIHISDVRNDPTPPPNPPITGETIYKVYLGWVKCTKQYDKLISLKNGGGSELRFGRGFANSDANGNVNAGIHFIPVDMKRRDIRKGNWKQVLMLWDTNWTTDKIEQALCIYEDDDNSPSTFTTSASYTSNGQTYTTTVSTTVQSKDPIIRNFIINRTYYFGNGTTDQGWGFQMQWPIFDGNLNVRYTLPYEVINL
ncbi:MAG TPA: hypothetical protein VIK80_02320 [Flavihumibacter sp.]